MKVLIACEFSGVVRDAFRALGHEAWSCDLRECEPSPWSEYHIVCDVRKVLGWNEPKFDLLIAHPPCTHLSLSGARWATDHWVKREDKPDRWHDGSAKRTAMAEAAEFFRLLLDCDIPRRCIENPMSRASTLVAPKSQTIHPWQFGHPEQKTTWLWLRNLPPLEPTDNVYDRMMALPKRERERIWSMPPGPEREKMRSVTYSGIAKAMAEQWGKLPLLS